VICLHNEQRINNTHRKNIGQIKKCYTVCRNQLVACDMGKDETYVQDDMKGGF